MYLCKQSVDIEEEREELIFDKHFGEDRGENKKELKFTTTMNLEESTLAKARNIISKISSKYDIKL